MDYESHSIEELVKLCAKNSDPDAWREFDRRFRRLIGSVVIAVCRKWGKSPYEHVQDLVNDTYLKLMKNNCALLVRFKFNPGHENAFLGYLRAVAASVSHDFFRKPDKETPWDDEDDPPARENHKATEMLLFFNDIDRILRRPGNGITERDRTIFWLYYRQGLTCKEIASFPAFHLEIKGVESVVHRLTEYVRRSLLSEAGD